jgi:hypothetical protein
MCHFLCLETCSWIQPNNCYPSFKQEAPRVYYMVFIDQSLVFCVVFCILNLVCLYVIFPLVIVLSVLLKFRTSAYPFGIFKLFLTNKIRIILNVESERNMEYLFFLFFSQYDFKTNRWTYLHSFTQNTWDCFGTYFLCKFLSIVKY